jgi:cytochrome c2
LYRPLVGLDMIGRNVTPRLRWCIGLCAVLAACGGEPGKPQAAGGDVRRGLDFVQSYGCMSCHTLPEVTQARGQVGPPLAGVGRRAYLGGILPNTPENMVLWLMHPQKIDPKSAMPDLGVSEAAARDMTAYLYTLR